MKTQQATTMSNPTQTSRRAHQAGAGGSVWSEAAAGASRTVVAAMGLSLPWLAGIGASPSTRRWDPRSDGSGGAGELEHAAQGHTAAGVGPGLQLAATAPSEREVLTTDLHLDLDDRPFAARRTAHRSLPALPMSCVGCPVSAGPGLGLSSGEDLEDGEEVEARVQQDGLGQVTGAQGSIAREETEAQEGGHREPGSGVEGDVDERERQA